MPFVNGKWIHHSNCTWCYYKKDVPAQIKRGKVLRVKEVCQLHGRDIKSPLDLNPHGISYPFQPERYCEDYIQVNCGCDRCKSVTLVDQMEQILDK